MMSGLFGGGKAPKPPPVVDPDEDALALRRRLAARGGEQSTILTGLLAKGGSAQGNVFAQKGNLSGTKQ